jgi:hypothetical protein
MGWIGAGDPLLGAFPANAQPQQSLADRLATDDRGRQAFGAA